jgi:GntR family transcriptional repressor for pyruvate dehydrogenase complex
MLWGLKPVAAPNASSVAVEWLRGQIHSGLLLPGEKLPPERRLAEDIAISRVTLREALKILEGLEYISVKRGALGGAFVAEASKIQSMAHKSIARDPASAMRIQEYCGILEPASARLAAARREVPDLKRLASALDQLRRASSSAAAKQATALFRLGLAEASHNAYLFHSLRDGLSDLFVPLEEGDPEALRDASLVRFSALFDAVTLRQENLAEEAARNVVEADWGRLRKLTGPNGR